MKKDACKFAKWLGKNNWKNVSNSGKLWERSVNVNKPKKGVFQRTVNELYDDFSKNGKK